MPISDEELALDEVARLCRDLADHYGKATRVARHARVVALLNDLAHSRRRMVVQIEEQIRAMGNLPVDDDPDRETIGRLATRFKSLLRGDTALLEDSEEYEEELARRIAVALDLAQPAPAILQLRQMAMEAVTARGQLSAARKELFGE